MLASCDKAPFSWCDGRNSDIHCLTVDDPNDPLVVVSFKQEAAIYEYFFVPVARFGDDTGVRERILLVGVSSDLIIHHHTVNQTLGQQARVLLSQLQSAQPAQVLAL